MLSAPPGFFLFWVKLWVSTLKTNRKKPKSLCRIRHITVSTSANGTFLPGEKFGKVRGPFNGAIRTGDDSLPAISDPALEANIGASDALVVFVVEPDVLTATSCATVPSLCSLFLADFFGVICRLRLV